MAGYGTKTKGKPIFTLTTQGSARKVVMTRYIPVSSASGQLAGGKPVEIGFDQSLFGRDPARGMLAGCRRKLFID